MTCKGLFAHSMDKLELVKQTNDETHKRCSKCGYKEVFPRSKRSIYFVNYNVLQRKKWNYDSTVKELLQPVNSDGSVNEEFTEAYGSNPFDERTKHLAPQLIK